MQATNSSNSIFQTLVDTVKKYPANIAVAHKFSGTWQEISYTQLLEQTQNTAAQFRHLGVKAGDAVVLPSIRSANLCSQLLGILWVGAHYVFIDPNYPKDRQALICEQSGATIGLLDDDTSVLQTDNPQAPVLQNVHRRFGPVL